jgi:hypothetical protein
MNKNYYIFFLIISTQLFSQENYDLKEVIKERLYTVKNSIKTKDNQDKTVYFGLENVSNNSFKRWTDWYKFLHYQKNCSTIIGDIYESKRKDSHFVCAHEKNEQAFTKAMENEKLFFKKGDLLKKATSFKYICNDSLKIIDGRFNEKTLPYTIYMAYFSTKPIEGLEIFDVPCEKSEERQNLNYFDEKFSHIIITLRVKIHKHKKMPYGKGVLSKNPLYRINNTYSNISGKLHDLVTYVIQSKNLA